MPVLLPFSVLLGSFGALVYILARRFKIVKKTFHLQRELEDHQKKMERLEKKESLMKEKAIQELRRASEIKHKALRNLGAINDLMKKADNDITIGDDEEALRTLIQVISLDENHRKGNELLARLYLKTGRHKKAELIYKRLIDLYPFDAEYYSCLAHSFFQRHQFKMATGYYEKALQLDKNNGVRYINLGHVFATRKDYGTALEYYTKAHRMDVRNIELMFLIIETCLQNSDPITAREFLHRILDYEPYNQQAKTLLGEVLRTLKQEETV
jgi:tetratricopeptide (TPR) repeat protein